MDKFIAVLCLLIFCFACYVLYMTLYAVGG